MARTLTYSDLPCEHCRRESTDDARGPALWITDARPLDSGEPGMIFESDPGEPKLCDACEMAWRRARRR